MIRLLEKSSLHLEIPVCLALKDILTRSDIALNFFRVVRPNTWVLLLEVNVNCNRPHIVERVSLVKGKSESSFSINPWCINMPENLFWIILAWSYCDLGILGLIHWHFFESLCLRNKTVSIALCVCLTRDTGHH